MPAEIIPATSRRIAFADIVSFTRASAPRSHFGIAMIPRWRKKVFESVVEYRPVWFAACGVFRFLRGPVPAAAFIRWHSFQGRRLGPMDGP